MTKHVKTVFIAAMAVSVFAGNLLAQAPAGSPVDLHGQLSVKNGQIVDKNNEPFQMRGMSFFWSTSGWGGEAFYTSGVVDWLASDWKVDVVRVARDPGSPNKSDAVIAAAIAKGLYVVIDWHSHNATNQLNDAKTYFSSISNTYKNTPNVIYEIYNEPCPSGQQNGKCLGETWSKIKTDYAQPVVNAIRANDTKNLIVIGSPDFDKRVDQAANDPVSGSNLVYSVHYYTAEPGSEHQGTLRGWCLSALSGGLALLVTEFGLSEADGGIKNNQKIDTDEADVWFNFLDQYRIGWMNWSINSKSEAASALKSGANANGNWTDNDLSPSGRYIRNKLRYYATTTFALTLSATAGGTISKSPDKDSYPVGTPVTVTAAPNAGFTFAGFEGNIASPPGNTTSPVVVAMNAAKNAKAVFEDGSLINKNGTFTSSIPPWISNNATNMTLSQDNYQLKATITDPGTATDGLRVVQTGLKLDAGRNYVLTFKARGQSARSIMPRLTNGTGTADYLGKTPINLTATEQSYRVEAILAPSVAMTNAILRFDCGGDGTTWYLDDVKLADIGASTAVADRSVAAHIPIAWSVSNIGGALQLRGPIESGARVSLYDTRGKAVKSMAAKDGLTLNTAGLPAGSYFVVVKNRAGSDVYRSRISFVR